MAPIVGSIETRTLSESELLEIRLDDGGGKHQSTDQRMRVQVKVVAVEHDRASKLEVTADESTRSVRVESNREDDVILHGVYLVTRGDDDHVAATRPENTADATAVEPRELDSLDAIVGDVLGHDATRELVVDRPLRVGETVPIELDLHRDLLGQPVASRYTLSLVRATPTSATYQIDMAASSREPNLIGDIDFKGRETIEVDRRRGVIVSDEIVTFKTERRTGRASDTLAKETKRITPAP